MKKAKIFLSDLKLYLLNKEGLSPLDCPDSAIEEVVLVSTELCLYFLQDLSDVPDNLRQKFISQRVLQLSPFSKTAHYAYLVGDRAQLWIWDENLHSKIDEGMSCRFLPEQLFLDQPDGTLCARYDESRYQLEVWESDVLLGVKLFPEEPDEVERAEFMAEHMLSSDVAVNWQQKTFEYLSGPRDMLQPFSRQWFLQPKVIIALSVLVSGVLLSGFGGYYLGWNYSVSTKRAVIEETVEQIQPLLVRREKTLALDARNKTFSALFQYAPVVDLVAEFEAKVGEYYDELIDWNYERGELAVLLVDSSGDSRRYIEALSASPMFREVSAAPGVRSDSVLIRAGVVPGANKPLATATDNREDKESI